MRFPRTVGVSLAALALVGVTAGSALAASRPHAQRSPSSLGTVTIANEDFTESDIMQYIYGDLLQHAGYTVHYQSTNGRTEAIAALKAGSVQVVPDYAGSLLLALNSKAPNSEAGNITSAIAGDNSALKGKGVVLPGTAGLDQNVFVVTQATKSKYHLTTLSSLKSVASKLIFGAPSECPTYYFCEPGLKSVYGIKFKSFISTDESGPVTVAALKQNRAQVVELFSTDNIIGTDKFYALQDNKNLEPADHLVAVIAKSLDNSKVTAALESVNMDLTTSVLTQLDASASLPSKPTPQAIAQGFLTTEKLI